MTVEPPSTRQILLVYDKECPACDNYCRMIRLRESVGAFTIVNAREDHPVVDEITAAGLDIDQGMVLKLDHALYYGADAIHMLSLLSSRAGLLNRLNYWLFGSRRRARWLYPVLRFFRNLLLKMLGRSKINNLGYENNERF